MAIIKKAEKAATKKKVTISVDAEVMESWKRMEEKVKGLGDGSSVNLSEVCEDAIRKAVRSGNSEIRKLSGEG